MAAAVVVAIGLVAGVAWLIVLRPVAVTVAAPERDVVVQVFGLGTVEARVISRMGFELAGTIAALHVDVGDRVRAGQLLARLDSHEAEARLAQARAGVTQAEAAVRQAAATVARARASLRQRQQVSERRQELVRRGAVSSETAEDAQTARLDGVVAAGALTFQPLHAARARAISSAPARRAPCG